MGSTTVLYSDILCPVPLWISVGAVVINLLFGLHPPALTCQVFDHFSDGVTQGTKVPVTQKSSFCIGKFASLNESESVTIIYENKTKEAEIDLPMPWCNSVEVRWQRVVLASNCQYCQHDTATGRRRGGVHGVVSVGQFATHWGLPTDLIRLQVLLGDDASTYTDVLHQVPGNFTSVKFICPILCYSLKSFCHLWMFVSISFFKNFSCFLVNKNCKDGLKECAKNTFYSNLI